MHSLPSSDIQRSSPEFNQISSRPIAGYNGSPFFEPMVKVRVGVALEKRISVNLGTTEVRLSLMARAFP